MVRTSKTKGMHSMAILINKKETDFNSNRNQIRDGQVKISLKHLPITRSNL